MITRFAGILAFALLGVASLVGSDAKACARNNVVYSPECGYQCLLTRCHYSGPGSTYSSPCGTCQNGDWLFCCADDCHCGD
jgi:hypothetical protein